MKKLYKFIPATKVALSLLFAALLLGIGQTAMAFHFPWDQGHDTTNPNDPNDPGPCEGPECENDPCNGSSTGSPVYLSTGQFIWTETDVILNGRPSLSVSRTFNSHDPRIGLMGAGWSMSCDQALVPTIRSEFVVGGSEATIIKKPEFIRRLSNGKRYVYEAVGNAEFKAPGLFDVVKPQGDGTAKLIQRNGSFSLFGPTGQLLSEVDRNGNAINYLYDAEGRLIQKADTNGREINFEYNLNGLISSIIDHTNREWQFGYDDNANLTSVTDPLGGTKRYEYEQYSPFADAQEYSHLTAIIDETGVIETQVTYGGESADEDQVSSYSELGNTFEYAYDENNNRTTKTDSLGSRWVFTYNETGQFSQIVAPLNRSTSYQRDEESLLTKMIDPSGTEVNFTYDEFSNKLTESDGRGTATIAYDGEKPWPTSVTSKTGRAVSMTYDDKGNLTTMTDSGGKVTKTAWSAMGDLKEVENANGQKSIFTYSPQGMPLNWVDQLGRTTQHVYDVRNNLLQVTNPAGEVIRYQYDALDRVVNMTDAEGDVTAYEYDAADRITKLIAANGEEVIYQYDVLGRLTKRLFYDDSEHLYTYRPDNLLASQTRPDGVVITFEYDAAKRMTKKTVGTEDIFTYSYNSRDETVSVSNSTGTVTMTYDSYGRLLTETVNGNTTSYQYNNEDEVTTLTSLGIEQSHTYDVRGLMSALTFSGNNYQYQHDDLARLNTVQRNASINSTLQYDAANQVTQINHGSGNRSHTYQYDLASRVSQWQGTRDETQSFGYDKTGRLEQVDSPTVPETFEYDALGNRQNLNAQFDAANRITQNDDFTYSYDANGNMTQKTDKTTGEVHRFSYNSLNQLVAYQVLPDATATQPTTSFTYNYGPLERRWNKENTLTQASTLFYWSGSSMIGEAAGGVSRRYVYDGNTPLAYVENGQAYHYLYDHLETAHEIVDGSGTKVWQANYSSFGEVEELITTVENNIRFAGQYHDRESGLYYNYFRDYDPSIGRYIQSDGLGLFDGPNTYLYVHANPLNEVDPTGEFGIVGGLIGGGIDLGLQLLQNGGNLKCVNWWSVGASTALGAVGAGVGLKLAGKAGKGKVFSHWVPSRAKNWPGFGNKYGRKFLKKGNRYNGNYVSQKRHYKHDPYAYGNKKGEWRNWGRKWPRAGQQLDRIPNVYKGAGAGGVAGHAGGKAAGSSSCECN